MHLLRRIPIAFVKLRLRDGVLGQEQLQRLDLMAVQFFVRVLLLRERRFLRLRAAYGSSFQPGRASALLFDRKMIPSKTIISPKHAKVRSITLPYRP